jgi:hypothetical protein
MTNTQSHAKKELDILLKTTPDAIIKDFVPEILEICEAFGNSGQSGASAPYTASALSQAIKKLCLYQPICPITGIDEEWNNCSDMGNKGNMYQNNRCSNIFKKGKDGRAYFLDAIVWQGEDDYDTFTGTINGITSRQYIKSFPFEPKTFYINVVRDFNIDGLPEKDIIETGLGKYTYKIKDENEIKEVFNYYDKYKKEDY